MIIVRYLNDFGMIIVRYLNDFGMIIVRYLNTKIELYFIHLHVIIKI
jgi:hypothetical protein